MNIGSVIKKYRNANSARMVRHSGNRQYVHSDLACVFLLKRYVFLYYCDVTIIHRSAKEELYARLQLLFLES